MPYKNERLRSRFMLVDGDSESDTSSSEDGDGRDGREGINDDIMDGPFQNNDDNRREGEEEKKDERDDVQNYDWRDILRYDPESETFKSKHIQFWGYYWRMDRRDVACDSGITRSKDNLLLKLRSDQLTGSDIKICKEALRMLEEEDFKTHADLRVIKELLKIGGRKDLLKKMKKV